MTNGKAPSRPSGNLGVFSTVDDAVTAAGSAFQEFQTRPVADRRKAVEVDPQNLRRSGRGARTARARKRPRSAGSTTRSTSSESPSPTIPGVEYLRTDNASGDNGLTLTDYVPFGVIGAITPVTHSLPTLAGNAINMLAAGNTVVFNAHPSGAKIAAEGLRRFNKAIREAIGLENLLTIIDPPTLESAAALFDHKAVRLLVVTGGPAVARAASGQQEARDRRRPWQSSGRRRRIGLPGKCRPLDRRRWLVR